VLLVTPIRVLTGDEFARGSIEDAACTLMSSGEDWLEWGNWGCSSNRSYLCVRETH